jgi:hypothetical protein
VPWTAEEKRAMRRKKHPPSPAGEILRERCGRRIMNSLKNERIRRNRVKRFLDEECPEFESVTLKTDSRPLGNSQGQERLT